MAERASQVSIMVGAQEGRQRQKSIFVRHASNGSKGSVSNVLMYSMLQETCGDDLDDVDFDGDLIVKPAIAVFLERLAKTMERFRSQASGTSLDEDSDDEGLDFLNAEDNDWNDETLDNLEDSFEKFKELVVSEGHNFAALASLVASNSFSLSDKRLDGLLGGRMPLRMRKAVVHELSRAVNMLWDQFRKLLLNRFGNFEAAFRWLDDDSSGAMERGEFSDAYVELHLDALAIKEGHAVEEDGGQTRPSNASSIGSASNRSKARKSTFISSRTEGNLGAIGIEKGLKKTKTLGGGMKKLVNPESRRRLNKTILKAEAKFLFNMLHIGERGCWKLEENDNMDEEDRSISMQHLVMILTGVGEAVLGDLREWTVRKYITLQAAFAEFGKIEKDELNAEEFLDLFRSVYASSDAREHLQMILLSSSATSRKRQPVSDGEMRAHAAHIFKGLDVDGSGTLGLDEIRRALSGFGSPVSYGIFRRRVLLTYGSFDAYLELYKEELDTRGDTCDALAFDLDMISSDVKRYSDWLKAQRSLEERGNSVGRIRSSLAPAVGDGFTTEEFAIGMFLVKSEDLTIEEFIAKRWPVDRDKAIPFRDFSERLGATVDPSSPTAPSAPAHGQIQRKRSMMPTKDGKDEAQAQEKKPANKLQINGPASAKATPRPSLAPRVMRPSVIAETANVDSKKMTSCSLIELRRMYEAIERKHRRVTLNILFQETKNVSDVLAIDKSSYQSGDRILCKIRLSPESLKRCKEKPVLCVVSTRLEWKELGSKSHWVLDGEKIHDFVHLCDHMQELPRNANGAIPRELFVRILAPFTSEEHHEIRLIASSNGREPGRQVGRSVAFSILRPAPDPPLVDKITPDLERGEASVVLHWSPPGYNLSDAPVENYILHVEPVIYSRNLVVESAKKCALADAGEHFNEVLVWSPGLKRFSKKLSYGLNGLCRGVQYRFGVQCVHSQPSIGGRGPSQEIRGARSELCDTVTMPLFMITSAPGAPRVSVQRDWVELVWTVPHEGLWDTNRICTYFVQYREKPDENKLNELNEDESELGSSSSTSNSSSGDDSSSENGSEPEADDEGWNDVEEGCVYIGPPQWVDYLGWHGNCHIVELTGRSSCVYQFRLCAVNYAGPSPWSKASAPVKLSDEGRNMPNAAPHVDGLEVIEVRRGDNTSESQLRGQCHIRWRKPLVAEQTTYSAIVRESHPRGNGGWNNVGLYLLAESTGEKRKTSILNPVVEALVTGLDRFPSFAPLTLQVRASSRSGSNTAEIEIVGGDSAYELPVAAAPRLHQAYFGSLAGPPLLELEWEMDELAGNKEDIEHVSSFQLLAAEVLAAAQESRRGGKPQLGEFQVVPEAYYTTSVSTQEGVIKCLARGFAADKAYAFRVRARGHDGRLGEPSVQNIISLDAVAKKRRASITGLAQISKPVEADKEVRGGVDTKQPKKPRNVNILCSEDRWCELSWEQRVPVGQSAPSKYDVEQSADDLCVESTWCPVKKVYTSIDDVDEETGITTVRAVVFFAEASDESCAAPGASQGPRRPPSWRLRVRAAGATEWSNPTGGQQEHVQPMLQQPPAPHVLRVDQQYIALGWTVSSDSLNSDATFEIQVQARQQRSGKLSDWSSVPIFIRRELASDTLHEQTDVSALVDKRDAVKVCKGTDFSSVRFRVRSVAIGGVCGLPSEASEVVTLVPSLPPAATPSRPEIVGRGRILMDAEDPTQHEMITGQFVRLHWALPDAEVDATWDGSSLPIIPQSNYTVETEDPNAPGSWHVAPGSLIEVDRATGSGSALVLLPPTSDPERSARFRIAANRSGLLDATWSLSGTATGSIAVDAEQSLSLCTPEVQWHSKLMLREPPTIVHAKSSLIVVLFSLSQPSSYAALSTVMAVVEARKVEVVEGAEKESDQDVEEDEMFEDEEGREFQYVGEFPVHWSLANSKTIDVRQGFLADANESSRHASAMTDASTHLADKGFRLEGVISRGDSSTFCEGGSEVRVRLILHTNSPDASAMQMGHVSEPFVCEAEETPTESNDLMVLHYPEWPVALVPSTKVHFQPKALTRVSDSWREESLLDSSGKSRVRFQVVRGTLPSGLTLDEHSGILAGTTAEEADGDSTLILQATPVKGNGGDSLASTAVVLHQTWKTGTFDSDSEDIRSFIAVAQTSPTLLSTCLNINQVSQGDAGSYVIDLIDNLLKLPSDAIVIAADLAVGQLFSQLCNVDLSADSQCHSESEGEEGESETEESEEDDDSTEQTKGEDNVSNHSSGEHRDEVGDVVVSVGEQSSHGSQSPDGKKMRRATICLSNKDVAEIAPLSRKAGQHDEHAAAGATVGAAPSNGSTSDASEEHSRSPKHRGHRKSIASGKRCSDASSFMPELNFKRRLTLHEQANDIKLQRLGTTGLLEEEDENEGAVAEPQSGSENESVKDVSKPPWKKLCSDEAAPDLPMTNRKSVHKPKSRPESPCEKDASPVLSFHGRKSAVGPPSLSPTVLESKFVSNGSSTGRQRCHSEESEVPVVKRPEVQMLYKDLTPLLAAFTDVEFVPELRIAGEVVTAASSPDACQLTYSVTPNFPNAISIDPLSGTISGSPFSEQASGCQYNVVAKWSNGDVAALCAVAFAVVSPELASLCNGAYLGWIPPSFRSSPERSRAATRLADAPCADADADAEQQHNLLPPCVAPASPLAAERSPNAAASPAGAGTTPVATLARTPLSPLQPRRLLPGALDASGAGAVQQSAAAAAAAATAEAALGSRPCTGDSKCGKILLPPSFRLGASWQLGPGRSPDRPLFSAGSARGAGAVAAAGGPGSPLKAAGPGRHRSHGVRRGVEGSLVFRSDFRPDPGDPRGWDSPGSLPRTPRTKILSREARDGYYHP
eukprot:TRINITY_DN54844_c0_g1_i1.p1 TRINITY_DN54844_c0_g1~~TRINITY_DN54844_c0_g1_i1.p1  ORF type:complete len:2854 (-),score=460.34 TRINITY_DN54844_c0_g1_i1:21-8582(-)